MKKYILICLCLLVTGILGCGAGTERKTADSRIDVEEAFQQVAYSYYMRGKNIQYNSVKASRFPPEEATDQNINYMNCSGFTQNVYKELLGIIIPRYTNDLLDYSNKNLGRPEVIGYGCKEGNNFVMKLCDATEDNHNHYKTVVNPSLADVIPYLRCGDIITYTGHTILVYDLKHDASGKVVDVYVIQSGFGEGRGYVKTKIPKKITIGKDINFGSWEHYLYHNVKDNVTYANGFPEGSLNITLLTNVKFWKNLDSKDIKDKRDEYSVLRFIQKDKNGNPVISYLGSGSGDKDYKETAIKLSDQVKDRLTFKKLFIEKTVDAHADNIVEPGAELTYTLTVKNNSDADYKKDIKIAEKLSEFVTFKDSSVSRKNVKSNYDSNKNRLEWNAGRLSAGETIIIKYTVSVKNNSRGKMIESTGTVESIPSAVVRNKVGINLTAKQENLLKETYAKIKDRYTGKVLLNEIYKQGLGLDLHLDKFAVTDLVTDTDRASKLVTTIKLNRKNAFYNSVLNKYWNVLCEKKYPYKKAGDIAAYDLKRWKGYNAPDRRADTVYGETFKTGDILIYKNSNDVLYSFKKNILSREPVTHENGEYAYIFIEGKGFVGVNYGHDGRQGTADDRNEFSAGYYRDNRLTLYSDISEKDNGFLEFANYQTLFGKDLFVILRPSLGMDAH